MSLVTYIIFAKTLYKIHEKKSGCNEWERMKDETAVFRKQSICQHAQDLRVSKIDNADECSAKKVDKKDVINFRNVFINVMLLFGKKYCSYLST